MIYRVHYYDDADGSTGFAYVTSRRKAEAFLVKWRKDAPDNRGNADIEAVETPKNRREVVNLLARWASHPDNG